MIYSDGVTEAQNPEAGFFGKKRLREVVEAACRRILRGDSRRHSGSRRGVHRRRRAIRRYYPAGPGVPGRQRRLIPSVALSLPSPRRCSVCSISDDSDSSSSCRCESALTSFNTTPTILARSRFNVLTALPRALRFVRPATATTITPSTAAAIWSGSGKSAAREANPGSPGRIRRSPPPKSSSAPCPPGRPHDAKAGLPAEYRAAATRSFLRSTLLHGVPIVSTFESPTAGRKIEAAVNARPPQVAIDQQSLFPCCACAIARLAAVVGLAFSGAELVTSSDRIRRSKSVSRMELRSVRIASSKLLRLDPLVPCRAPAPRADPPDSVARPRHAFTVGNVPMTSRIQRPRTCSGSRTVLSIMSASTVAPDASSRERTMPAGR